MLNYFVFVTFTFKICDSKRYTCESNSISRVPVLIIKYHALVGENYKKIKIAYCKLIFSVLNLVYFLFLILFVF